MMAQPLAGTSFAAANAFILKKLSEMHTKTFINDCDK